VVQQWLFSQAELPEIVHMGSSKNFDAMRQPSTKNYGSLITIY